jgi:hypothetical protein
MSSKFLSLFLILVIVAVSAQVYISPYQVQANDANNFPTPFSPSSYIPEDCSSPLVALNNSASFNDPAATDSDIDSVSMPLNSAAKLSIITNSLNDGESGALYSSTLQAVNGVSPYKWSKSGNWPAGLTLNAKTGVISGKPSRSFKTAREYSFTITVIDSATKASVQTFSKKFTITIYPVLDIAMLPNADAGSPYSCKIPASGGKLPYSWGRGSTWPVWLSLNPSTGTLLGTPPTKGTYKVSLLLSDRLGNTLTKTLAITVNNPLLILTTVLPDGEPGLIYPTMILKATGGAGAKNWNITAGNLPSGLSLSTNGIIKGKPNTGSSGNYPVTIQVVDGIAAVSQNYKITIYDPLLISPLPDGMAGTPYSHVLGASGGSRGYKFSIAGALPQWLKFNSTTAALAGTPVDAGIYSVTVNVTDSISGFAIRSLTLKIGTDGGGAIVPGDYDIGTPTLTDLWVDPVNGDDENGGTSRREALRTLTAAWDRIPDGARLSSTGYRIQLVPGTYPLDILPSYMENRHGTYKYPVIIKASDGAGTVHLTGGLNIFNCEYLYLIGFNIVPDPAGDALHFELCNHVLLHQVLLNSNGAAQETLKANQCSFVYVEKCDISGSYGTALDFVAVQYGHILGSRVHNAGDWCMYLKGGSAYFLIEGNELYDGNTGGFTAGQGTGFEFMLSPWLHYETYDIKFINNVVHDTHGAGMGVNGSYNILLAFNTLYRVGERSHAIEVVFGLRGCDGDVARCKANLAAGGWGTIRPGHEEPIPNRNVFIYNNLIYNPPGYRSEWNQFAIYGPQTPSLGTNIPSPATTDTNLRIRGNIIFNGPPDLLLGVGEPDQGGQPSNPTCNANLLLTQNAINTMQPQLVNPAGNDFRPTAGSNVLSYPAQAIPNFTWTDAPYPPAVPAGQLTNNVARNRDGDPRTTPTHPGAY